MQLLLLKINNT